MVIYCQDIRNITGASERTARRLLARIRKQFNKQPGNLVTLKEFCQVTGIDEEYLKEYLAS